MARPNLPRSIGSEANLAERLKYERTLRGWSPAELAQRMTAVGCSINTSAIYKIEDPEKPRRITVDELIAASQVFGIAVQDLLVSVELAKQERARKAVKEIEQAERDLMDAVGRFIGFYEELFFMAAEHDMELFQYTSNLSGAGQPPASDGELPPLFVVEDENGRHLPVNDERFRAAYLELILSMIEVAGDIVQADIQQEEGDQHGQHQEA